MTVVAAALLHLAIAVAGVVVVWLVQLRTRNAGVVDAVWPLLVGVGGPVYALASDGDILSRCAVAGLSTLWALRLGGFLAVRNVGSHEDRRYTELRERWGASANRRMLGFFVFQALIAWIVGLSFAAIAFRVQAADLLWLGAGLAIGLLGIAGEAIADHQLQAFKRDPAQRGRVCDRGLWRWSRHPNYFFECVHWAAYPLLAAGAVHGWSAGIGLIVIAALLLKVSGIPTVEAAEAARRRVGYDDYVRRTSAFIPWPPRRED